MESYGIRKKIDQLGRITLPASYRSEIDGMGIDDEVIVCRIDDGILIKPVTESVKNDEH